MLCSPSTHLMASTIFDLPEPLGHNDGNTRREIEPRFIGKALEANEFESAACGDKNDE